MESSEWKYVHNVTRLQKSRSIDALNELANGKEEGACPPLPDGASNVAAVEHITEEDKNSCDAAEPMTTNLPDAQVSHDATHPHGLQARVDESPEEERHSNRRALQRSCSVDELCRGYESPQPQHRKSSFEVSSYIMYRHTASHR